MDQAIFMTGATGFVGSHFLYRALCEQLSVFCLVRAPDRATGYRRLTHVLETASAAYPEGSAWKSHVAKLRVVIGDITEPVCGVNPSVVEWLAGTQLEVWHFAASLRFDATSTDAISRVNVDGTRNALALAKWLGAARFVQLSTAYTAGAATGVVAERLHALEGPFHNEYERSKCRAEHEVCRWGQEHRVDVRIARPSIVVGPQCTGLPGGASTGLYGFMRELFMLRRTLAIAGSSLVTLGEPETPLNLVPVDRVVDELLTLRRFGFPFGPIYHLTSDACPNVGRAVAAAAKAVGVSRLRVAPRRVGAESPIEHALDQRTRFYSSYLGSAKRFERRAGAGPKITLAQLARYCEGFASELKRRDPLSMFERRYVGASDGVALTAYANGSRRQPAVVLVNAYGLSVEAVAPLAARLAQSYRVITWRARGLERTPYTIDLSIHRHARDLRDIMAAYEIPSAHIVGWCSGADVALTFACTDAARALSLTLLNGALLRGRFAETLFQQRLGAVVAGASRSPAHAGIYHKVLHGTRSADTHGSERAVQRAQLSGLLGDIDPSLLHLASRPFLTPNALYRYALCLRSFLAERGAAWPDRPLVMPTLVVTGTADKITNPDASRAFARHAGAQLLDLPDGDHFAHVTTPAVADEMLRLFATCNLDARVRIERRAPSLIAAMTPRLANDCS